jgi:hypothetical protein
MIRVVLLFLSSIILIPASNVFDETFRVDETVPEISNSINAAVKRQSSASNSTKPSSFPGTDVRVISLASFLAVPAETTDAKGHAVIARNDIHIPESV